MQARGAIVVGGYVNGVGVLRALAARGIPTAVVTTQPYDVAQRSRWCVAHGHAPDLGERPDALLDALEPWRTRFAGFALLPTNDEALVALGVHRERLAAAFRVLAPPLDVTRRLVDKKQLLDAARATGVDVPRSYGPATGAVLAHTEIRYPVVVKPVVGYRFAARFDCKLFVARDAVELRAAVARLDDAGLVGEVFDLVPGADDRIYVQCAYLDAHGEPVGGVTVRKLRQSPHGFGVARVAEVVAEMPALRDATLAVVRRLGLTGAVAAEFKHDPRDGRFRFLEVNGRSVIYNALLRRVGLDVAGLAWDEHVLRVRPVARSSSWAGVWINLHADLLHAARRDPELDLASLLRPYRRPVLEALWSARDPGPFLAQWGRSARIVAARLAARAGALLPSRVAPHARCDPESEPAAGAAAATPHAETASRT